MAQYYNIIANTNGVTLEDGSQYYSVDGQTVQVLQLENIGNGVAYAPASPNNEQTGSQTISLSRQISAQLDSRPNVYIIKNDSSPQGLEFQLINQSIVNSQEIKTVSLNTNPEGQQMQWMSTQDDSASTVLKENVVTPVQVVSPVRNQQSNITLNTPGQFQRIELYMPNSTDKKDKFLKGMSRQGNVVQARLVQNSESSHVVALNRAQNSGKCYSPSDMPVHAVPEAKSVNAGVAKVVTPSTTLHYPEMEHLSERIRTVKQQKAQGVQTPRQVSPQIKPGVATKTTIAVNRQATPIRGASLSGSRLSLPRGPVAPRSAPVLIPRQVARASMGRGGPVRQVAPLSQPRAAVSTPRPTVAPPRANVVQRQSRPTQVVEPMEVLAQESEQPAAAEPDSTSSSVAILQEEIKNPQTAIVQRQIEGNMAKMLVALQNGEQRLITFDIPKEDCTVHDLLEQVRQQAGIQYGAHTTVSLVSDPSSIGINYIVDAGSPSSAMTDIASNSSDTDTGMDHSSVHNESSSQNFHTCDENSNSSMPNPKPKGPRYITGKLALCPYCGLTSTDFHSCGRCRRTLPENVKILSDTPNSKATGLAETKKDISVSTFYKKSLDQNQKLDLVEKETAKRLIKRGPGRPKKQAPKEPECLTISSDEEDNGRKNANDSVCQKKSKSADKSVVDSANVILDKEPIITNNHEEEDANKAETEDAVSRIIKDPVYRNPSAILETTLSCRTVRIGSYKYEPSEEVKITSSSLSLKVPLLEDENQSVAIEVPMKDLIKVLINFGKNMPLLFYYASPQFGAKVREVLGMQDPKGYYYDPAGREHIHKRITLIPEVISDESRLIIKTIYGMRMEELTNKEANEILIRASPTDQTVKKASQAGQPNEDNIQTITVYPQQPGGITINTEDYMCLGEDQFLNDVIIDFYLKYLTLEVLSPSDRNRTHVFSSYFYKRLTSPQARSTETMHLSAPAKRHARVQKWTKNVNIFKKDFIVIPINEHAHWFLAIICFPGLVGKVATSPIIKKEKVSKPTTAKTKEVKIALKIGSTTITPVSTTTITLDPGDDGSERDEAEGDDDEMEMDSTDEEGEIKPQVEVKKEIPQPVEQYKLPCILIFDSLAGASRSRVVATLRDYLQCEHQAKMGVEKAFTKDTIKGSNVKVPQQSNFTDCGLYVLQYVESFFKDPIKDYRLPIKTLKNWFEEIVVTRKREEISKILISLMTAWKGDREIVLPPVVFPTLDGKLKKPEPETKSGKAETDSKKKTVVESEKMETDSDDAGTTAPQKNPLQEFVPYSSSSSSSSNESPVSSERLLELAAARSSTKSMNDLKTMRITRIVQKQSVSQEFETPAKKYKPETSDSCK